MGSSAFYCWFDELYLHILTVKNGGTGGVNSLSISEISNQLYVDTAYYPNTPIIPGGFNMTDIVLPSMRTDTINDIVLSLPGNGISFGNYLTRDTTKLFYNNNLSDFRSFFKGLHFQLNSTSSDPYLISLSLLYDQTNSVYHNYFVLFTHDSTGTANEYSFILDAKNVNACFNTFSHDLVQQPLEIKWFTEIQLTKIPSLTCNLSTEYIHG